MTRKNKGGEYNSPRWFGRFATKKKPKKFWVSSASKMLDNLKFPISVFIRKTVELLLGIFIASVIHEFRRVTSKIFQAIFSARRVCGKSRGGKPVTGVMPVPLDALGKRSLDKSHFPPPLPSPPRTVLCTRTAVISRSWKTHKVSASHGYCYNVLKDRRVSFGDE